jgi:hypothetical protein
MDSLILSSSAPTLQDFGPDRAPAPPSVSLHACMRARLANDDCVPGWPLSRNGSAGTARGLRRKIVLLSSELCGFAPSREPVIATRPGLIPLIQALASPQARPDDIAATPDGPALGRRPQAAAGTRAVQTRDPVAARRCFPVARKNRKAGGPP